MFPCHTNAASGSCLLRGHMLPRFPDISAERKNRYVAGVSNRSTLSRMVLGATRDLVLPAPHGQRLDRKRGILSGLSVEETDRLRTHGSEAGSGESSLQDCLISHPSARQQGCGSSLVSSSSPIGAQMY